MLGWANPPNLAFETLTLLVQQWYFLKYLSLVASYYGIVANFSKRKVGTNHTPFPTPTDSTHYKERTIKLPPILDRAECTIRTRSYAFNTARGK